MLRFDIPPVCSNAYRFQAAMGTTIAALYLFTPYKWAAILMVVAGFVRGFISPHKCPAYLMFSALTAKLGWSKMVNAGAKMFADKIAFVAGMVMVGSWLVGSEIGMIPATAILIFAFLDLVTGFCAACWVYGAWYKMRAPA